jgi:hypothetical protein
VGGVYGFTRAASANLREKDDSINEAIAGFLGGGLLGLRCKTLAEHGQLAIGEED